MVKVKGICDLGSRLQTYFPTVDTFISSISYEERYIRGYQLLVENNISVNNKLLFYYNEVLRTYNRVGDEAQFDAAFAIGVADTKLYVDLYNEMDGLLSFKSYLEQNRNRFEDSKNIIIDLSVMVKPYFLLLLKHLSMVRTKRVGFIYTEPNSYDTFTKGTIATKDILAFQEKNLFLKKMH